MRIALLGDSHGYAPALEAALVACRAAAPDLLVFCGDLVTVPFSPDPPAETIALLRAEDVRTVFGNHDLVLRSWGTPEWEAMMVLRMARGYPPGPWIELIPRGQALLSAADLAWLQALPEELTFDASRPGDAYVCHAIPGNPFLSLDGSDPRERTVPPELREEALRRPKPAAADLILCGHSHVPQAFCRRAPDRHAQTVVRTGAAMGWDHGDAATRQAGYTILTQRAGDWQIDFGLTAWRKRDPSWTWRGSLEAAGFRPTAG